MPKTTRTLDDHRGESLTLLRRVRGELPAEETRRLEARLAGDVELRRRYEALESSWRELDLPPAPPLPEGFRDGVMEQARRLSANELDWSGAPRWARTSSAAALVLGVVLGLGLGRLPEPRAETDAAAPATTAEAELDLFVDEIDSGLLSLAEAYWLEIEDGDESLAAEPGDEETL